MALLACWTAADDSAADIAADAEFIIAAAELEAAVNKHTPTTNMHALHNVIISDNVLFTHYTPKHDTPMHDTPTHDTPTHNTLMHDTPTHNTTTHNTPTHDA